MSNKSKIKKIRLSENELEDLKKVAEKNGMNPSEYLRASIYNRPNDNPEYRKLFSALTYELHKIGVNINQIAYRSNTDNFSRDDRRFLLELMKDINSKLLELIEYGYNNT